MLPEENAEAGALSAVGDGGKYEKKWRMEEENQNNDIACIASHIRFVL